MSENTAKQNKIQALELWQAGKGYAEIAKILNTTTPTAWRWVKAELESLQSMELYSVLVRRELENQRLNTIMATFWPIMLNGDAKAARIVLDTVAKRIELYALSAPKEQTIHVQTESIPAPSRNQLISESIRRMSEEELEAEIEKQLVEYEKMRDYERTEQQTS